MHCTLIQVNMNEKYLLGWLSILPFPPLPTAVSAFKYLRKRVKDLKEKKKECQNKRDKGWGLIYSYLHLLE